MLVGLEWPFKAEHEILRQDNSNGLCVHAVNYGPSTKVTS